MQISIDMVNISFACYLKSTKGLTELELGYLYYLVPFSDN
jgi:hypothetical protein